MKCGSLARPRRFNFELQDLADSLRAKAVARTRSHILWRSFQRLLYITNMFQKHPTEQAAYAQ